MIIRNEQNQALREAARLNFEGEMVQHLAGFSPPLYKAAGEKQIRETIQLGMKNAAGYGFDSRGPVRLYLEMMLLFGSYFDTDPQYPWTAEVLTRREAGMEMERANFLYERTLHYRQNVSGPEDAHTLEALRNMRAWTQEPLPLGEDTLVPDMLREIERLFPQKAEYTGREALEQLIRKGGEEAQKYQFGGTRGVAVMVVLMIAFGHGCSRDPLYPWIGGALNDPATTSPAARAKRLEKRALTWLDHVLAYFDKGVSA